MREMNQQETDSQKDCSFLDLIESVIIGSLYVAILSIGIVFIMGIGGMLYKLFV